MPHFILKSKPSALIFFLKRSLLAVIAWLIVSLRVHATVLVDDTWIDGTRSDPASPTYSENGTDADADGDLESAWFKGGAGTFGPVGAGGPLRGDLGAGGTSSASWTTYFTPEASPITLTGAGDTLKLTWQFTLTGVAAPNTSQNFRLAIVNSTSAARLASDSSPGSDTYAGYGMFMNMGTTLGNGSPFQLMERTSSSTSSALLSASGSWTGLGNGATSGTTGYADGTLYTYVMTLTLNASGGLDIVSSMTGGSLNGSGTATVSVTDTTPNSLSFDTFSLRPSSATGAAQIFDTSLLKVEFIPGATPPSIDVDPQDRAALVGQDVSFTVLASGTMPLGYQWYHNTNTSVADATNSALMLTNVQLSDAGTYTVLVTNSYGSVTSAVAQLTVNAPVTPSILTQPQDQTVSLGATATLSVVAGGSEPLSYQWYLNDTTPVANANDPVLTLTNVQVVNAGSYSVVVSNVAGSITSSNAVLTVDTNPVAPVFITQPASQVVVVGSTASFTATAAGTAPISYQWYKNGTPLAGTTSSTLTLTNVQTGSGGSYTLTASNSIGTATSDAAQLTVTATLPVVNTAYNLVGFAQSTTGGGIVPESNTTAWRKVYTAVDLATVLNDKTGNIKVIEIMNDLDLGYNEIPAAAKASSEPFRQNTTPSLHPVLIVSGVSKLDIQNKNNLTIFSANGATIRHAHWNVKRCVNVIIRNLKFDELWEWDEATKGDYDSKNWDFMTIGDSGTCTNVWVDHCTFTKAYDGGIDIKGGSSKITVSWCKFAGDDGATNTNSWVRQQINYLQQSQSSYTMYNFLRTRGFSVEDIVAILQGHEKTMLIGATDKDPENANFTVTLHHDWFVNPWDRLPRLRAGNVHNFNIYVDDTLGLAAKRLRDARAAVLSTADQNTLNNTYNFKPFLNGSISTEGGAVLVEKSVYIDCLTPLRNNQTDPSDPTYTGKILALDTIYQMDSTVIRGNSTDSGNPLGPFQAPRIAFSWNLPGNQLPYPYTMDDPSQLQSIVTSPTAGAGAGVLTWAKTNWLLTAYAPTAPVIVADPQDQDVLVGDSATFVVVAGGSPPLKYQWFFNTNTPLANATNATLTFTNLQTTNAGTYSVVVTNVAGAATSLFATLTVADPGSPLSGFDLWQTLQFTPAQLADPAISGPDAAPASDGVPNFVKYALGLEPFVPAAEPLVGFRMQSGEGVLSYNRPASAPDVTYRVEIATSLPAWTTNGVSQQLVGTNGVGLQTWDATCSGPGSPTRFFRLLLIR
jgi:pectate lyase